MLEEPQPILVPIALGVMLLFGIGLLTGFIPTIAAREILHATQTFLGVVHK